MNSVQTTIFGIKRYALHDGPAIRTTIFFKGCPLACYWCHNPEGIEFAVRLLIVEKKCVGCRECVEACSENALQLTDKGLQRDRNACTLCTGCVNTCPALAHEQTGWTMSTEELLAELKKDLPFFEQSGGGVTISGGEPLCQPEGLTALLQGCKDLGIHSTLDTSGFAPTSTVLEIAPLVDLFLYDLKHMDSRRHLELTGVANEKILHNLKSLADSGKKIRIRIPLMRGINDSKENLRATGSFVADCRGVLGVDVLPYHPSATAKYKKLAMAYRGDNYVAPSRQEVAAAVALLQEYISDVRIGG